MSCQQTYLGWSFHNRLLLGLDSLALYGLNHFVSRGFPLHCPKEKNIIMSDEFWDFELNEV